MTSSDRERLLEALKNYKPTEEAALKFKEWMDGYEEYMKKPEHDGNCHCARCMAEFLSISS